MAFEISYTSLRANLTALLDRVAENREVAIIRRRGADSVALLPLSELTGLIETAHLLRSPANARRFLRALHESDRP